MTLQTMSFIFGALLLAVGILGGGFEVKEVKVSNVNRSGRILATLAGIVFIVLGFIPQESLSGFRWFDAKPVPEAKADIPDKREWRSRDFAPPNAGLLAYTFIHGNPACASYNAHDCLWGVPIDKVDFAKVKPLICGAPHLEAFGETGFDNPKHWCNVANAARDG